ncbi:MAG: ribonuclease P protein component 4 [Candidatus Odinarchaeum yellowstonii]|jgi:RNase P subunit RPR2|uniref:Ribonuclease P protein component 4 n=1 Tax=Odinarchaeota yellowstonii (strain LCB_4) TaxID=1841599 RepID=A0AAF0D352_ODILC|nr:MAG: ribonuclease P protein component 4 [Candidatus Odinarchaeum yellowstonii]
MRRDSSYRSRIKNYLISEAAKIYNTLPYLRGDKFTIAKNKLRVLKHLAMKTGVRLPKKYKRVICKKCGELLIPGRTARVRVKSKRQKHIVQTCLKCGYMRRFIIKGEKN